MFRRLFLSAILTSTLFSVSYAGASSFCQLYPHWQADCSSPVLANIEKFITAYKNNASETTAAFDWDGTLYNEQIAIINRPTEKRSGQSAFHQWGADQIRQHHVNNFYPEFKTGSSFDQWAQNVQDHDDYLEGKAFEYPDVVNNQGQDPEAAPLAMAGYAKFSQITSFATGMKIEDYFSAVDQYLADYPVQANAFNKTLDIMQRLQDAHFNIWVITGSNPYFVATLIHRLDTQMGYHLMPSCSNYVGNILNHSVKFDSTEFFNQCHIAGNADLVSADNKITAVYDNRNTPKRKPGAPLNLAIVDHYGKCLAAQNIIKKTGPIVLYAGNSNGDYSLMTKLLNHQAGTIGNVLGIFVQPNGDKLTSLLADAACKNNQCIQIDSPKD